MPFPEQPDQEFTEEHIMWLMPAAQSGVLGICNDARWLYIEQAADLRARLLEHVRGQSLESGCILANHATCWRAEFVPAAELESREAELIREYRPPCNTLTIRAKRKTGSLGK